MQAKCIPLHRIRPTPWPLILRMIRSGEDKKEGLYILGCVC